MSEDHNDRLFKLFYFYWFISLFHVTRIIGFLIPPLKFLNSIPQPLFLLIVLFWLLSPNYEKRFRNPAIILFFIYLFSMFISTLVARNTGRARSTVIEHLFLLIRIMITLSIFDDYKRTIKFLMLHLYSLIFIGCLGVIEGGRIFYIPQLNDEDAYGPLMAYGVSFSWFLSLAATEKKWKRIYFLLFLFFIFAVAYSHARGALIALGTLLIYLVFKHPQKIRTVFKYSILVFLVLVILVTYFQENTFVKEMLSILDEGQKLEEKEGTGASRMFLWSMGFKMLIDKNILFGVGPQNFGVWLPEYAEIYKDQQVGLAYYGQVAHNDYITAISELGVIGFILYLSFIFYFIAINIKSQKMIKDIILYKLDYNDFDSFKYFNKLKFLTYALQGSLIATLVNHFFYALFYYMLFFWTIFILNLVNYQAIRNLYFNQITENI